MDKFICSLFSLAIDVLNAYKLNILFGLKFMDFVEDPFERFEERRRQRDAERMQLQKRLIQLKDEGEQDAIATAQLRKIYPDGFPGSRRPPDSVEPAPSSPVAAAHAKGAEVPVKEMILTVIREAYPESLTAKQIRAKAALRYGVDLNPNTLTVTLVRYSKLPMPLAKCEGRLWRFLKPPPANGTTASSTERTKSPEVTGLL